MQSLVQRSAGQQTENDMNAKQVKIIAALNAELLAANATKAAANDAGDEAAFDAACARVNAMEIEIHAAIYQQYRKDYVCPVMADLVAKNID